MAKDHNNYDYLAVSVKSDQLSRILHCYRALGWTEIKTEEDRQYYDMNYVRLRRPHRIANKDRLQYLQVRGGDFSVLVGPDKLFVAALVSGAKGVVSGIAGPMPEPFVAVYKAWEAGDIIKAGQLQKVAVEVTDLLRGGSDMAVFKEMLRRRGIVKTSVMRKPLLELLPDDADNLWKQLQPYLAMYK